MKRFALAIAVWLAPLAAMGAPATSDKPAKATTTSTTTKPGKSAGKKASPPVAKKALAADALDKLRADLLGDEDAAALAAVKQLGESGASNAADPLVEILVVGTEPERAQAALDGLAKLANPSSIDVLELYSGHRTPEVRRRAVAALGAMSDGRVVPTLLARLGDGAPDVRAVAADALAARKEKKATGRLFKLVKKNDAGAAAPLGILATPDLIPQIAELQGAVNDEVLATAMGEYIKRTDVPDKLRVEVIKTMGKLSDAATTTALIEYLAVIPAKEERASQREAQKIIDERSKQR